MKIIKKIYNMYFELLDEIHYIIYYISSNNSKLYKYNTIATYFYVSIF